MRRLNLMIICSSSLLGGTESHLLNLVRKLDRERFNINFVCPSQGNLFQELKRLNIKPVIIDIRKKSNLNAIPRLVRLMRENRVDIVQTYGLRAMFFGHLAAKFAKVKIIVSSVRVLLRAQRKIDKFKSFFYFIINKFSSIFSDKIVVSSNAIRNDLIIYGRINPQKIVTIYNSIDLESFKAAGNCVKIKDELRINPDSCVVGIVARLVPEKAINDFIQAALMILKEIPQTTFLVIGDGPLRRMLEELVSELGLNSNIVFTGFRTDIPDLISIFDVAVLSSIFEGFGIVILEYMALGKPVVATRIGGIPEIITDKENGLLVSPQRPDEMARAVISLLNDEDKARQIGLAARTMVESRFSAGKMVEEYHKLYLSLAQQNESFS